MAKIKAVSVAIGHNGSIYIVDTEGHLIMQSAINGRWSKVELPDVDDLNGLGTLPKQ
jgi:hypothetical protein